MAKRGTLDHPKTKRLARALQLPAWAALGLLESLWHWCGRYALTGALTSASLEDCADTIRFEGGGPELARVLLETGWIDETDAGFYVHDWHDHADDTTKKALAKRGESFANGSVLRKPRTTEVLANHSRIIRESVAPHSRTVSEPVANDSGTDRESVENGSRIASESIANHSPLPEPSLDITNTPQEVVGTTQGLGDSRVGDGGTGEGAMEAPTVSAASVAPKSSREISKSGMVRFGELATVPDPVFDDCEHRRKDPDAVCDSLSDPRRFRRDDDDFADPPFRGRHDADDDTCLSRAEQIRRLKRGAA